MAERPTVSVLAEAAGGDVVGDPDAVVVGVTHDSRAVKPGMAFCCVRGDHFDGHDFALEALAAGAAALVVDHPLDVAAPQVVVADVRAALGAVAAAAYGHPDRELLVVGVTGTNGKTTTVALVAHIMETAGRSTEVIGTLTSARTTPEATDLHAALRRAVDNGRTVVAMEVSSHALALHRTDGIRFAAVLFTNLGIDHLDFHGTPERYFEAKARLFEAGRAEFAVIDVDGPNGRLLRDTTPLPTIATSVEALEDLAIDAAGSAFSWRGHPVRLPMFGRHNVANALLAAEACRGLGVDEATIVAALATAPGVPGRFQEVPSTAAFRVIVDFAHTPDALAAALGAARDLATGNVTVVFGCGGDRDTTKRPRMGRVADELADAVIITSDNPRSEDPSAIMAAVRSGVERVVPTLIVDRREAIAAAVGAASSGDVILIAGKGHETTQTIGEQQTAFDDRQVAAEALRAAGYEVER